MLVGASIRRIAACPCLVTSISISLAALGITSFTTASEVAARGFACNSGAATYEVRSGDSWNRIASAAATSAADLTAANGTTLDALLVVGDVLCLPSGADLTAVCETRRVRSGDSWYGIARAAGVPLASLLTANGAEPSRALHPGDTVCLPAGSSGGSAAAQPESAGSYEVARGDSWSGIADRAGVTMRALLQANGARSTDVLLPGDVLRLPAGAIPPAPRPSVVLDAAPTQGPCGFVDTWGQARSANRVHLGVDVFSGAGNYVYAVVDGKLTGRVWDGAGQNAGNAWTLTGADGTRFFYAHLSDFAPELRVGARVRAGQIIGWVGDTGNASAPHLHFEVRPQGGGPVNPYSILRAQGGCNNGTPYTQPGGWVPERLR